jgi:uncharacterized protein
VVGVGAYSYSETYNLEVKEYTFTNADVPAAFDGARIVLLCDIHRSWYFSQKRVANVVTEVNDLKGDLIVLGGDYVYGSKDQEASTFAELARLKAPLGVFAILGNHDYAHSAGHVSDPSAALRAAAEAKIPIFDNAGTWIEKGGQRFRLAGVSDLREGHPEGAPAIDGATASDLVVLLSHTPDFSEELAPGEADLVLSGHTHGGQFTFFGLWAPLPGSDYGQKFRTGLIENTNNTVIVSNGVGTTFLPFRFFARPQIVVVTLHRTG